MSSSMRCVGRTARFVRCANSTTNESGYCGKCKGSDDKVVDNARRAARAAELADESIGRNGDGHLLDSEGRLQDGPNGEPASLVVFDGETSIGRYQAGVLNDGPNGEPAMERRREDGSFITRRYGNGVLSDGPNGEPAMEAREADGRWSTTRYAGGVKRDSLNGDPCTVTVAADGTTRTSRYWNDVLNDGVNGEPAIVVTDAAGTVISEHHYRDGFAVKAGNASLGLGKPTV